MLQSGIDLPGPSQDMEVLARGLNACTPRDLIKVPGVRFIRALRKPFYLIWNPFRGYGLLGRRIFKRPFTPRGWLRSARNFGKTRFRRFPTFHFSTPKTKKKCRTLNGRLPLEYGSVRPQTLGKCVSDDSQHFIFRRRKKKLVNFFKKNRHKIN